MKIKKLFASVLVVALLLLFVSPTYAFTTDEVTATSSSSTWFVHGQHRDYSGFSLSGPAGLDTEYGHATKLTVRAYTIDHTKLSNAKTYKSGSLSGGQSYWSLPTYLCVKTNHDYSGNDTIYVRGTWRF